MSTLAIFAVLLIPAHQAMDLGDLRTDSTPTAISLEWGVAGDSDNDATCKAQYRAKGCDAWKDALPLFRVNYRWWYGNQRASARANKFAGSILFLQPSITYEVRLTASDPDGGGQVKVFAVATQDNPHRPVGGRILHVVPGSGTGSGTTADPIQGIARAALIARAGDTFLLHTGQYGIAVLRKHGTADKYIVWTAAEGEAPVVPYINLSASYQWFEGLTFIKERQTTAIACAKPMIGTVVRRNSFSGYRYTILVDDLASRWHITDNNIVGDGTAEGIELNRSGGHVVAHNSISNVSDGVSYPKTNCDIYGNDIDAKDDAVEADGGYSNIRIWGNRLKGVCHGISFQPMRCGPWYIIRNEIDSPTGYAFKFRVQDRFLLANNTITGKASDWMQHVLTSTSRNNHYKTAWTAKNRDDPRWMLPDNYAPNWMTDVDYDGFEAPTFVWDGKSYASVPSFAAAVGVEKHGVHVQSPADLIDAGDYLPNIHDGFKGKSPDIGCQEQGKPAPMYGPRSN